MKQTKLNQTYKILQYNLQNNTINTIIQIEKTQMKPNDTKTKQTKSSIIQYNTLHYNIQYNIVCVEVLRPSQPNGVMSSAVSLPNHTYTGQA